MNIEVAERLVKLRKEKGLSQEELADKLGISRQAVSKWERAEASPDTDNLIMLARLYGVSLDYLLDTDASDEEIKENQKNEEEEESASTNEKNQDKDKESYVHIGPGGIHIKDSDDSVDIDWTGIHINEGQKKRKKKVTFMKNESMTTKVMLPILYLLAFITFILLGYLLNYWHWAWVLFLIPDVIVSFVRCIEKKNPKHFNITFLSLFVFFFVCMGFPGMDAQLWHPMWVVFLAIPIYHIAIKPFHMIRSTSIDINPSTIIDISDDDDDD